MFKLLKNKFTYLIHRNKKRVYFPYGYFKEFSVICSGLVLKDLGNGILLLWHDRIEKIYYDNPTGLSYLLPSKSKLTKWHCYNTLEEVEKNYTQYYGGDNYICKNCALHIKPDSVYKNVIELCKTKRICPICKNIENIYPIQNFGIKKLDDTYGKTDDK